MRLILLLAALLAAAPAAAEPRLKVVATFSILADLVREVGGETVEVTTLVGPDSDAHTYQPRPTDARTLATARVLVSNGLGFEGWIDRLADAADFKGTRIVASTGAPADADPHCWQDVGCARRYIANIARGLAAADPANAAAYRARAAHYDQRLAALDGWIRREIAAVPEDRRHQGLVMLLSVRENLSLPALASLILLQPTGTVMGPPVSMAFMPRTIPSVGFIATVLTRPSPRCCCTSTITSNAGDTSNPSLVICTAL